MVPGVRVYRGSRYSHRLRRRHMQGVTVPSQTTVVPSFSFDEDSSLILTSGFYEKGIREKGYLSLLRKAVI